MKFVKKLIVKSLLDLSASAVDKHRRFSLQYREEGEIL